MVLLIYLGVNWYLHIFIVVKLLTYPLKTKIIKWEKGIFGFLVLFNSVNTELPLFFVFLDLGFKGVFAISLWFFFFFCNGELELATIEFSIYI